MSNNLIGEWCLIESNPCIFYDMLKKMDTKNLSVEDVYSLDYFDDYINNRSEIKIEHILGIEEYKNEEINKDEIEKQNKKAKIDKKIDEKLYNNDISIEIKYNKLLKNNNYIYGIIFLFNMDESYKKCNKKVATNCPENLFFAKQVIPNACATQAILSVVLNKDIELNDEIKNIKIFSHNFDSKMKGLTLSNCSFLRDLHNSYKEPIYVEESDNIVKKSNDSFHFVTYIEYENSVYLLDGFQNGPIIIESELSDNEQKENWLSIVKKSIQKEIERISGTQNNQEIRFNILTIIKDKESIINNFLNIHRIIRQRVNIKLISLGENIELQDEINDEGYCELNSYNIEYLTDDKKELYRILENVNLEINYLNNLWIKENEIKKMWNKELAFKFFNFSTFIMTSLNLMAKHKLLKSNYEKEKARKNNKK